MYFSFVFSFAVPAVEEEVLSFVIPSLSLSYAFRRKLQYWTLFQGILFSRRALLLDRGALVPILSTVQSFHTMMTYFRCGMTLTHTNSTQAVSQPTSLLLSLR